MAFAADAGAFAALPPPFTHLGDTHHAAGDHEAARNAWQQALTILDQLDHPDADAVRVKLDQATPEDEEDNPKP